jgi:HNH endonuclease
MAKRPLPCPTRLRLSLQYEAETGEIVRIRGSRGIGKKTFATPPVYGYLQGGIFGGVFATHRVIWAIAHGYWPKQIDHINGIRTDNRLCNLREVDDAENRKNMAIRSDNSSGYHGVRLNTTTNKWRAEIRVAQKNIHIGCYSSKSDAIAARKAAEIALGFHQNHGRSNNLMRSPCH